MKRKIVRHGPSSLTISLPAKWAKAQGLKAGDEVDVVEKADFLTVNTQNTTKEIKQIVIDLDKGKHTSYRSLIGGLYRGGCEEVLVKFKDPRVVAELQKTVDMLYGFDIFDVKDHSCIIKTLYREENTDVAAHITKMIHTVKTIQVIMMEDIEKGSFESRSNLRQFKNNILKQRDMVARIINQNQLMDNKYFPNYLIAFNLWYIARRYIYMYYALERIKKVDKRTKEFLMKTNNFFSSFYSVKNSEQLLARRKEYKTLIKEADTLIEDNKVNPSIGGYCRDILMMTESSNSSVFQLSFLDG